MVLDELDRPFRLTVAAMAFVAVATVSSLAVALIMDASLMELALGLLAPCAVAFVVARAGHRRSQPGRLTADH